MKSQILLVIAAAVAPALAGWPKLNQYKDLDDCKNDKDILYHAAPPQWKCYNLDEKTGAFFWNSGLLTNINIYEEPDCKDAAHDFPQRGWCMEKGNFRSYMAS